jgi:hypothetical protein
MNLPAPSVGRIVLTLLRGEVVPAIVTGVINIGTVNVQAFPNNHHQAEFKTVTFVDKLTKDSECMWPPKVEAPLPLKA